MELMKKGGVRMTESDINKLTLIIQGWLVFMFLMAVPIFFSSYDASYGIPISCGVFLAALILLFYRRKKAYDSGKVLEAIAIVLPSFIVLVCQVLGMLVFDSDGRRMPFNEFLMDVGQYCKIILIIILAVVSLIKFIRWIGGGIKFKMH